MCSRRSLPVEMRFHSKYSERASKFSCRQAPGAPRRKMRRTIAKIYFNTLRDETNNQFTLIHLDFLEKELKRLLGAGDNKLLEKVFEKLINLVFIQVVLN